jgi:hypothetical protein
VTQKGLGTNGLQIVSERMTEKIVQGILDRFGTKNFNPKP